MQRLLIITLLDYKREPNGRIHHLVAEMGRRFEEITVLYGTFAPPGPAWRVLLASLRFGTRRIGNGSLREIQVRSFLNYPESLAKRIAGYPASTAGRGQMLRLAVEKLLSTLGIVRDLSLILSFLVAMLRHARGPFQVVLVQCPLTGIVGLLARRLGIAECLIYDDIDYAPGWCDHGLRRRWIAGLEARSLVSADRVISCGHRLATLRTSQSGQTVPVIPNGVKWDMFQAAQEKIAHGPTVIYMGRVADWAGLEVAFEAIAGIREEIPDLRLLVLGRSDPAYERRLRSVVSALRVEEAVRFVGEVKYEDLPEFLRQADVGLATFRPNPMKDFAFPLKVIEYMAAGVPVVGIRGTETARIIEEHDVGLVVEFTPAMVAGAIRTLLRDRHLYARCAANAARSSMAYDWRRLMEREYGEIRMAYARCGRTTGLR
jgi:glycosyltransferase involved in cell wall biosynthesis